MQGPHNRKALKVYDICNNAAAGNSCTYNNNKNYKGAGFMTSGYLVGWKLM